MKVEKIGNSMIITYLNGVQAWYRDNMLLHREDGPAVIGTSGYQVWCRDGKRHREDGPAVVYADGTSEWWIDGKQLTESEFISLSVKSEPEPSCCFFARIMGGCCNRHNNEWGGFR